MENFRLKETVVKEEYKVTRGGVFAVNDLLKSEREVDGAELIAFLEKECYNLEDNLSKLKGEVERAENSLADNLSLLNDLKTVYHKVPKRLPNGLTEKADNGEYVYEWQKRR